MVQVKYYGHGLGGVFHRTIYVTVGGSAGFNLYFRFYAVDHKFYLRISN